MYRFFDSPYKCTFCALSAYNLLGDNKTQGRGHAVVLAKAWAFGRYKRVYYGGHGYG
jgi:hypothetical protein